MLFLLSSATTLCSSLPALFGSCLSPLSAGGDQELHCTKRGQAEHLHSGDGTREAYQAMQLGTAHAALRQRDRQTDRALSTRLQLVAQRTFWEVSFLHDSSHPGCSMPCSTHPTKHTLGSNMPGTAGQEADLSCWVHTIRQGKRCFVPRTLYSTCCICLQTSFHFGFPAPVIGALTASQRNPGGLELLDIQRTGNVGTGNVTRIAESLGKTCKEVFLFAQGRPPSSCFQLLL